MQKVMNKIDDMGYKDALYKKLKGYFESEYKDTHFKELVDMLKLPKSELIKYTSSLKTSSLEFSNCKKCKNLLECKNSLDGYCYLPRVESGKIIFENKACKYMKKRLEKNRYLKNIYTFSVPSEIMEASMDNIYTEYKSRFETIEWIHKFLNNYPNTSKGLYLNGGFGSGKTYLVASLFCELAKKNIKSAIVFWPEILRDLKSSFGFDFKEKYEYLKKVPLLLIDDIGAENMTEWNRDEILCPLLQYRMQAKLPTFFTSNFTIEELEKHFEVNKNGTESVKARRVIERIKQLTDSITMVSKNLR